MSKPRKARLKIDTKVPVVNARLNFGKSVDLDIDGKAGPDGAGNPTDIRVHMRIFYRIKGVPFSKTVIENFTAQNVAPDAPFSLAQPLPFIPRHATDLSFVVLAWDVNDINNLRKVRRHLHKVRVK